MVPADGVAWMLAKIEKDGCVYQDDVVDYLLKQNAVELLRENSNGNLVLGKQILAGFLARTTANVVWVKPERYWRRRVPEDEPGHEARG